MKRFLPALLVVLLLFLVSIGGFLVYRLLINKPPQEGVRKEIPGLNQEVGSVSGSPIHKGIYPEKDGFMYELVGSFADEPVILEERDDKAIQGKFIIKGDPMKREIDIIIGEVSGQVNLGTYKGSLDSGSTWSLITTREAYEKIKQEKEIKLRSIYTFKGSPEVPDYAQEVQNVMDVLINEFNVKKFDFEIPENFTLSVVGVGIISQ